MIFIKRHKTPDSSPMMKQEEKGAAGHNMAASGDSSVSQEISNERSTLSYRKT
jgi:hypothetical protein